MKQIEDIEFKFIDKIHCNFPYSDMKVCESFIDEAKSISANAVYTVIEELARVPVSDRDIVSELELKNLLQRTIDDFEHPLLDRLLPTVELMIENREQTVDNAILLMTEIENYPGLWGALSLAYFSCDDIDGIADRKYYEIRERWNKNTTP